MNDTMRSDLVDLVWTVAGRMIVMGILAIYGFVNMNYLSESAIPATEMQTLNLVFAGIGLFLFVYVFLPVLRFGIEYRHTWFGKYASGLSVGGLLVAVVLMVT